MQYDPAHIGPYELLGRLGAGGMGQVFLGRSASGALAAVKVLHLHHAADAEYLQRFSQEVGLIAKVRSEHTAAFIAENADGRPPWLATQYVPGLTLAEVVTHGGPVSPALACHLGVLLTEGLEAIHSHGVIHRDLKPTNVLVVHDGIRIIDFGIAKRPNAGRFTAPGFIIGTLGYMAPEQLDDGDHSDFPSDVFALAVVLAEAMTGRLPFSTTTVLKFADDLRWQKPDLDGVPAGLADLLRRCLQRDQDRRPGVEQVRAELIGLRKALSTPGGGRGLQLPAVVLEMIAYRQARAAALAGRPRPPRHASGWRPWKVTHDRMARMGAVAAGDAILIGADDGLLVREAQDGSVRWTHPVWPVGSVAPYPPVVVDDLVLYATVDGTVALDLHTGAERWRFTSTRPRFGPVVDGATICQVGAGARNLYVLDAATGAERWRATTTAPPVPTGKGLTLIQGTTVQLRAPGTGQREWTARFTTAPRHLVDAGDTLVVAVAEQLAGLDPATGDVVWQRPLRTAGDAAPVAGGGVVLVEDGRGVVAIDPAAGVPRWTMPGARTPSVTARVAHMLVGEGLAVLDPRSGRLLWQAALSSARPLVNITGKSLYIVDGGLLRSHRLRDGTVRWTAEVMVLNPPVVAEGVIYLHDGLTLYAIDAYTGRGLAA